METLNQILSDIPKFYGPFVGIIYMLIKVSLRMMVHNLVQHNNNINNWPIIAWTSVDLGILTIALSTIINIPDQLDYDGNTTIVWYVIIILSTLLSCFSYGKFMKIFSLDNSKTPFNNVKLFGYIVLGSFFGGLPFLYVLQNIEI